MIRRAQPDWVEPLGAEVLAPGLWRWTAWHPEWRKEVGSVAIEGTEGLVLVDPLLPESAPADVFRRTPGKAPAIVLTIHYHARSAARIARRRRGTRIWLEARAARRVRKVRATDPFRAGDILPGGLVAMPTARRDEVVLWHPATGSLIAGDVLLGAEDPDQPPLRMCPPSWLPKGVGHEELSRSLAALTLLPVERIVPGHGEPILAHPIEALRAALDI